MSSMLGGASEKRSPAGSLAGPGGKDDAMVLEKALGELGRRTVEYIGQIGDEVIDFFAPAGRGDLMLRFAREVPLLVMQGLLGMDERYAAGVGQTVPEVLGHTQYAEKASRSLDKLLLQLAEEKQQTSGPDVVSWMVHHGPNLSPHTIAQQTRPLLLIGVASSTTLLSHSLYTQLSGPGPRVAMADPADQPQLLWVAGEYPYPASARRLTALIVKTSLERLYSRLPDLRLAMPSRELLWTPVRGIRCPESIPVRFTPARMDAAADAIEADTGDARWPPEPIFTATPPTGQAVETDESRASRWRSLLPPLRRK
jgi:cytochrome P450